MFVYTTDVGKLEYYKYFFLLSSHNVMQPVFNEIMLPKSIAFLQLVYKKAEMLEDVLLECTF
jgi:presenilin-like A22 family membrane protease